MKLIKTISLWLFLIFCLLAKETLAAKPLTDEELLRLSEKTGVPISVYRQTKISPSVKTQGLGLSIKWSVAKEYKINEIPKASFTIYNNTTENFNGSLQLYYSSDVLSAANIEEQWFGLGAWETYGGYISVPKISEVVAKGKINFFVVIKDEQGRVIKKFKTETNIATQSSINLSVDLDKKVYSQGELVNIKITAPAGLNPKISVKIKNQSGKQVANLTKSGSWRASAVGTYTVEASATKAKYKPYQASWQFVVVAKTPGKITPPAKDSSVLGSKIDNDENIFGQVVDKNFQKRFANKFLLRAEAQGQVYFVMADGAVIYLPGAQAMVEFLASNNSAVQVVDSSDQALVFEAIRRVAVGIGEKDFARFIK